MTDYAQARRTRHAAEVDAFAARIKALGFRVFIAERGGYGCISDDTGARVVSFSFNDGSSLGGNYGPPSTASGTGWRLDRSPYDLRNADDVREVLAENPPTWCGMGERKGWRYMTTLADYLKFYSSSRFAEV